MPSNRNNKNTGKRTKTNSKENTARKNQKNANKKNNQKRKTNKKSFASRHPKLMVTIKVIIIAILLLCVIGAGVIAAMFFGLFGDEFEITKKDLVIGTSNSIVLDKNGNEIANLSKDEKRKVVSLDEMSEYLPKAYVAIEDKRFYEHSGVDLRRTAGAILNTVLKGNSSYGGSTITQQLVKNITGDKNSSGIAGITRKVKEWAKAFQVERMISKQQILELYLNILFVGGRDIHGVELGAQYYFDKSAKDLDLAECAFLAGINSSPNSYNPFNVEEENKEKVDNKIKNKVLTVLKEMKDQGYVTNEEDYNQAVAKAEAGMPFKEGYVEKSVDYSYHTDATLKQIIDQVMEEKGVSREFAEKYVYSSGLTIYSTEDKEIQDRIEKEFSNEKYIRKNKDGAQTQAGMVILDHKTGNVLGVGGNLGEQNATGWNRGTQMIRQTGSAMKPLATIVPGLEEKVITVATVYDDVATDFNGYKPENYNKFRGPINIREYIRTSQNIPAVKIMRELTPKKSMDYLKKMGISTLDDKRDDSLPLAIGGLDKGISPLEMAGAYGAIANNGVYITPTFYTKVTDAEGNVVLTPKQEQNKVCSEQTAYITREIIKEPVKSGTATYCNIRGMEVCAKTGTTDDSKDRWLCGFTPYYSAACWYGYDDPQKVVYNGSPSNPAGGLWSSIMKDIHKNLANAGFTKPSGIVSATVCRKTGCLATESCTDKYTEIFTKDNMPEKCEGHGRQKICKESGKIANEYCPEVEEKSYGLSLPKERLHLWKTIGKSSNYKDNGKIDETCTIHTKPKEEPKKPEKPEKPKDNTTKPETNTVNPDKKPETNTTKPETNTVKPETNTTKPETNTTKK